MRVGRNRWAQQVSQKAPQSPNAPKRATPEKDIQNTIVQYLRVRGLEVSVTNADRAWGKWGGIRQSKVDKGHPDLTAVLPVLVAGEQVGIGLYIEVKTPTGSLKPEQKEKLQRLDAAGALCVVARSLEDVSLVVDALAFRELDPERVVLVRRLLELNLGNRGAKGVREAIAGLRAGISARAQSD